MNTRKVLALVWALLTLFCLYWFSVLAVGCQSEPREILVGTSSGNKLVPVSCAVSQKRYPTTQSDMNSIYNGRTFYYDGVHLGYDIQLAEGLMIAPIACGTIRFYGAAKGYGQLVAVIEHQLTNPLTVVNGNGEQVSITNFLSIYGHLRKTPLQGGGNALLWKVGDTVGPNDVIGYVNDDAHNGDGGVHLHLGIRLQTTSAAQASDPHAWFRGYDGQPSQRRWYADPVQFMSVFMSGTAAVLWHPAGTVLHRAQDNSFWMMDQDGNRHIIAPAIVLNEHLLSRAVNVSDAELSCETPIGTYISPREGHALLKFTDSPIVYEYTGFSPGSWRKAFINYEAFQSWGWQDADIALWEPNQRPWFFQVTQDQGFQTLRDGTLVKSNANSEVCVVSQGQRLPIANWDTFLALGYQAAQIVTISANVIDAVAGSRGALITPELMTICNHPSACVVNCPPPSQGGGSGEDEGEQGEGLPDGSGAASGAGGSGGAAGFTTVTSSGSGFGGGGMGSSSTSSSTVTSSVTTTAGAGGMGGAVEPEDAGPPSASDSGVVAIGDEGSGVPIGKVHFHYQGPVVPGMNQMQGMWDPPGPAFQDWVPATFALCADALPNDGVLDCLLDMPSGTTGFLFTVHLPDGRWWGDWSCAPTGGCGSSVGTVTLTGPNGMIPYQYQSNQAGPEYKNGWVASVP